MSGRRDGDIVDYYNITVMCSASFPWQTNGLSRYVGFVLLSGLWKCMCIHVNVNDNLSVDVVALCGT